MPVNCAMSRRRPTAEPDPVGHSAPPWTVPSRCGQASLETSQPDQLSSSPEDRARPEDSLAASSAADSEGQKGPLRLELPSADLNPGLRLSPFSPSASVQTWLDANIVHSPISNEDSTEDVPSRPSGLPLPQSVINTLKVSTLYFPETMLLSSSLSIESIRTYARKLRQSDRGGAPVFGQDSHTVASPWSPPPSPPEHKKRFWPVFHRRGSQSHHTAHAAQDHHPSRGSSRSANGNGPRYFGLPPSHFSYANFRSANSGCERATNPGGTISPASVGPLNWAPFLNIFCGGSDYLCDALYAHIVAYNYVSCLCGRGIRLVELKRPKSGYANQVERQEAIKPGRIPKKAATLLGLSEVKDEAPFAAAAAASTAAEKDRGCGWAEMRKKKQAEGRRGTVPGLVHEPEPKPSAGTHGDKNCLRELQSALAGCVAKLVVASSLSVLLCQAAGPPSPPPELSSSDVPLMVRLPPLAVRWLPVVPATTVSPLNSLSGVLLFLPLLLFSVPTWACCCCCWRPSASGTAGRMGDTGVLAGLMPSPV